jgi:hypothetical protein
LKTDSLTQRFAQLRPGYPDPTRVVYHGVHRDISGSQVEIAKVVEANRIVRVDL